jgi:hypothetical protein
MNTPRLASRTPSRPRPETIARRILEAAIGDVEKAEWGDLFVYKANNTYINCSVGNSVIRGILDQALNECRELRQILPKRISSSVTGVFL